MVEIGIVVIVVVVVVVVAVPYLLVLTIYTRVWCVCVYNVTQGGKKRRTAAVIRFYATVSLNPQSTVTS